MDKYDLLPFMPDKHGFTLNVGVMHSKQLLQVQFMLRGPIEQLILPQASSTPEQQEGLYHHTCFEIFVHSEPSYLEWNFSPSGNWAQFAFDSYRVRSHSTVTSDTNSSSWNWNLASNNEIGLTLEIPKASLNHLNPLNRRIGLSAVLELKQGGLNYWALKHYGTQPDFHDPRGFTIALK